MKIKTTQILQLLHIACWIIFIGLCIKTGALLFTFLMSLFFNPLAAGDLYNGLNLSDLFADRLKDYIFLVSSIIIITGMKAYMCVLPVKIFQKMNLVHPFSQEVSTLITQLSKIGLAIGLISLMIVNYVKWLQHRGYSVDPVLDYTGGGHEYLFFGGMLFIVSLVYRRGVEIQSENELTV